jgi:cyclic beta-1,2-glucan synthetase
VPRFWREFEITYRRGKTTYHIKIENPHSLCRGVASVELDGVSQPDDAILLSQDGLPHEVRVVMGERISNVEADVLENQDTSQQQ